MQRRRREIIAVAGTAVVATAGCRGALTRSSAGSDSDAVAGSDSTADDDGRVEAPTVAESGRPSDICERPLEHSDIVAIGDPGFDTSWPSVDPPYRDLTPSSSVLGVTTDDGRARAYPLSVLAVHEVVNDDFGGPLLVTYCPLCRSGVVADRLVAGDPTPFDVTGYLWRPERIWAAASEDADRVRSDRPDGPSQSANLVMYDHATGSYWSQFLGQAICGPRTGDRLAVRPFAFTTWAAWQADHPDTEILLPPPASTPTR